LFLARPTAEELRHDLRDVLQRCRPDWDITTAEQRTAWARDDKTNFYPYGKNGGAGVRGMGIGLSVSRSIIERHHGRLWAEPNDGPGATFSFSIPRGPESVTDTGHP